MNAYAPREGSIAGRALAYLRAHGETATVPLADAIDAGANGFVPNLEYAVRNGVIAVTKRNGLNWYSVGDGKPLPAAEKEPPLENGPRTGQGMKKRAPEPEIPVFVPKAAPLPKVAPNGHGGPGMTLRECMEAEERPAIDAPFSCGLFSDGRFVVELGAQRITLEREQTELLIRFIERLAPEVPA